MRIVSWADYVGNTTIAVFFILFLRNFNIKRKQHEHFWILIYNNQNKKTKWLQRKTVTEKHFQDTIYDHSHSRCILCLCVRACVRVF